MKTFLANRWLTLIVRIALGVIFVVAAWPKITDPPSFAHMIYNYRLLPASLINVSALVMPWVEILAGIALILGIWRVASRNLIAAMLVMFIIAISINLGRGNAIDCGCFDVSAANLSWEERITDMKMVILRDIGMLLMVAQLWWSDRVRRETATVEP
ncbi:MAG TPA: MauE/DoxX family redox-associated membrane protein [Thermoanaerobaculia bacterium]